MIKKPMLHAVLTGDIVNSTQLPLAVESDLIKQINRIFSSHLIEFYRGDSFQAYVKNPRESLRLALLCRSRAISLTEGDEPALSDVRISIGIGPVISQVRTPGTGKGEAFILSGRWFDEMEWKERRLSIATGNNIADVGLAIMSDYLDSIFDEMTAKQAAVIKGLLEGKTQQEVASQLDKSKSTVSQLVTAAHWAEIEKLLEQFDILIDLLT